MNDDSKPTLIENQIVPEKELKAGTNETKECETKVELVETASRTLALIKPDAMQANNKNAILDMIKGKGFNIVRERELQLSREKAGLFYKEHEGKSFYEDLTRWMSSAPIYALVLEKEDAVESWRLLMGPTDSNKARDIEPNSVRALFGTDGSHNATHGSDSLTSAEREINIIFDQQDEQVHVTEVQDMTDKLNTQDVCKPDAIPEVIKATGENKDFAQAQKTEETNTMANVEHMHTAELVTSQDQVINLLDENTKQEHFKSQDTQNITQGNLDQVAVNDEIAEPNVSVATTDIVENESPNNFVGTETNQDNSKKSGIRDALNEVEIKQDTSIEADGKKDSSAGAEIKKDASVEAGVTDVSTKTEVKNEASIETEVKNEASFEPEVKNEASIEPEVKNEASIETEVNNDASIQTQNKKITSFESEITDVSAEIEVRKEASSETEVKNDTSVETDVSAEAEITEDASTGDVVKNKTVIETEVKNVTTVEAQGKKNVSVESEIAEDASTEIETSIEDEVRNDATTEAEHKKNVSADVGIADVSTKIEASTETEVRNDATIETQDKKDASAEAENASASIEIEASIETEVKNDTNIETKDKKDISAETESKNSVIIDAHDKLEEVTAPVVQDKLVSDEPMAVTTTTEVKKTDIAENETKEEKKDIEDVDVKSIDSNDQVQKELLLDDNIEKTPVNKAVTNNPADKDENATINTVEHVKVSIKSVEVDLKDSNEKVAHCDVQNPDESNTIVDETDVLVKDSIVSNVEIINKEEDVIVDEAVVSVEEKHTVVINADMTETPSHHNTPTKEKEIDNTHVMHQEESVCKVVGSETSVTEETNSVPVVSPDVDVNVAAKATDKKVEKPTANQDKAADAIIEKETPIVEEKAGLDTKENELNNKNDVVDKTNKQVKENPELEVSDPAYDTESVLLVTPNQTPKFEENVTNDIQAKANDEGADVEGSVASTTPADSLSSSSIISEEESASGTQGSENNKENDDHNTSSSVSSAAESLQSSENSSVTKVGALEDQVKEKKTKNSAAVNDKKNLRAPAASGLRTTSVADKKKTITGHPTTKTKLASSTLVKKKVPIKAEDASKGPEDKLKTTTKAGRVPRVALLAKKKVTTAEATTEEKPKKVTSTRSLVSRLTAPTAASARKKISTDATITTTTTANVRTKKPADPNQKKTSSAPPVKKNPASTIGSRVTGTKPTRHSSELKPKPPSATVRRTSPPTSTATAATKKATVAPIKRASKPAVTTATGTRVAASGLSSTQAKSRKETSSIATTKKATTVAHKKPATALKKTDSVSPPNEKVNTKEPVVENEENHSAEVLGDQKEIQQPADEIDEIKSNIVTEEDEKKCEESSNNSHEEDEKRCEESSNNSHEKEHQEEKRTVEQVVIVPEEVTAVAEDVSVSKEEDIVITEQVKQKETIEEQVVITEPELPAVAVEKEVESVIVNQPDAIQPKEAKDQTNSNAPSDAEIAAITQTNITNNKPQMASLRSRFENLNNNLNNINQLHTTPSKEIRSKSPNKISDMINRFTAN